MISDSSDLGGFGLGVGHGHAHSVGNLLLLCHGGKVGGPAVHGHGKGPLQHGLLAGVFRGRFALLTATRGRLAALLESRSLYAIIPLL